MPRKAKNTSGVGRLGVAAKAKSCVPASEVPVPSVGGRFQYADQASRIAPPTDGSKKPPEGGRPVRAAKATNRLPPSGGSKRVSSAGGRPNGADQAMAKSPPAVDLNTTIETIRVHHRRRCYAMETRKRLDLALGSHLRTWLGWSLNKPEAERKAIAKQAADIIESPEGSEFAEIVEANNAGRAPYDKIEASALKEMVKLARTLPVWETFGKDARGFGEASLAVIIAEAGDLSKYDNPGKLWKRMGLAVMGDVRQGGLAKNASKEDWIAHGYNRQRRSRMWNIGDALIKGNRDGEYRRLYLARKEYEIARDPEIKPIKAHRRAQRYMEKRLLKNLWQAWRRADMGVQPIFPMPVVSHSAHEADRPAMPKVPPTITLPGVTIEDRPQA